MNSSGVFRRLHQLAMVAVVCVAPAAWAQVTINDIVFPADIGRSQDAAAAVSPLDAVVTIAYQRTSSAAAVVRSVLPAQLSADPPTPPAGCRVRRDLGPAPVVECDVPAGSLGASGTLTFKVRGVQLGGFSLGAVATGGSGVERGGSVVTAGELTVVKNRSPLGNVLAGQDLSFTLQPRLATGSDNLPAGAVLTLTDALPGTATDFRVTAISPGIATCSTVLQANSAPPRRVTCTLTGPLTVAQVNAATVTITGAPGAGATGASGDYVNTASVLADQSLYMDANLDNNTANVGYHIDPASDLQASGSFPATPQLAGSAQNLTLTVSNNGPMAMPAGATVSTVVPAGFVLNALPPGCTGPATGVVLPAPAAVTCRAAALALDGAQRTQSFVLPLLMPSTLVSGNFTVTVAPAAGMGDARPDNNIATLPYQVASAFADLGLTKAKSPGSGPVAAGDTLTTELTVVNQSGSTAPATYSALGGGTELRVIDYLRPEEIAGDVLSGVTAGWQCTVATATDPTNAGRTRRVTCVRVEAGTLAVGANLSVQFSTRVAAVAGLVTLDNRACTGETALTELGLLASQGPQPAGQNQRANDCAVAGAGLVATPLGRGNAVVTLQKQSSADGVNWVDDEGSAPVINPSNPLARWRMVISTPNVPAQMTIPRLVLEDALPGILTVASPGAPAPAYRTPAVTVTTTLQAGSAARSCPGSLAAGTNRIGCVFSNVAPGTTLVVEVAVPRPFDSGTLRNTATVTSPNAVLTGTLADSAALVVQPRVDVAMTSKTVTPSPMRIGQTVQFNVTAQNFGPDAVATGSDFKLIDDLNTDPTVGKVAFADIVPSGANLSCGVATSALPDEPALAAGHVRVRCTSTAAVARFATRTLVIKARVQKPSSLPAGLPADSVVYAAQVNQARIDLPDALCEYKTETLSNASLSAACNDSAANSNNSQSVAFNVLTPQVDLQQGKERVLPAGQANFGVGQPLRYRFRMQNNGPSRAERVRMTDKLTVPDGFTLSAPRVLNINAAAPGAARFVLDPRNAVACTQDAAPANADLVCVLSTTEANNYLDAGTEVNFEVEFTQTGNAITPVTMTNQAMLCADESDGYESSGGCYRVPAAGNNNLSSVNDTVFPRTDFAITKTSVAPVPSPASLNQPLAFDLAVRNLGPQATAQIRLQDLLPANFELLTLGTLAPAVQVGAGVGATAGLSCSAVPATLATAGQRQTVTCVLSTAGAPFPGNSAADNVLTVRLHARARADLFTGPYGTDLTNNASVSPGQDSDGNPVSIDTVPGNNNASSTVQISRASLAGRVFNDRNGNGRQDGSGAAEDEGLGNVVLRLTGTDDWGNPITREVLSSDTAGTTRGDYLFDHLPPGTYTVTEQQPVAYVNSVGTPAAPSAGGNYSAAASATSSAYGLVRLGTAAVATGYLFPESLPGAVLSGTVFVDRDRNGAQGAGEPGISGVALGLYPAGTVCPALGGLPSGALQTVATNGTGAWAFTAATAGNAYVVCQAQPAGYGDASPLPGSAGSTPGANQINMVSLPAAGAADLRFPETLASLSGTVFVDHAAASPALANNGQQDAGEPGLGSASAGAGVPVTLTGTTSAGPGAGVPIGPVTVFTAADGSFSFNDLFPGNYALTEGAVPGGLGRFADGRNAAGPVSAGGAAGTAGAVGDNAIRGIGLTAGAQGTGNRFGELPASGVVSGSVYADPNGDGARQPSETGYAGQTVRLTGTDLNGQPVSAETTTDASGLFRFDNLPAGNYTLVQPGQPSGTRNGSTTAGSGGGSAGNLAAGGSQVSGITLGVAGTSSGNLFGEVPVASVAGAVFVDPNNDGVRQSGESGIGGQTLTLSGTDSSGAAVNRTTTTAADGTWRFDDLPPGTYSVAQASQPAGTANGRTVGGALGGGAGSNPSASSSLVSAITLAAGTASVDNNFGEIPSGSAITGRVWLDSDNSGAQNAVEPGIADVTIELTGTDIAGNTVSRSTRTDTTGDFRFDGLLPGNYALREPAQPTHLGAATLNGRTVAGSGGGTASTPAEAISSISGITLVAGQTASANLFGELPPASLGGRVFTDSNGDGTQQPGEPGLPGQTITVSGTDSFGNPVSRTVTTDASGDWRVDNLPPGNYTVTQPGQPAGTVNGSTTAGSLGGAASNPAGGGSVVSGITLLPGSNGADYRFAELPNRGAISGRVWLDSDNSGAQNGAEPGLPAVVVELTGTDLNGTAVNRSTTTDATGDFRFDDLLPGSYALREPTQPTHLGAGTLNGRTVAGSGGGAASVPATAISSIGPITLAPGQTASGNLFGELPPASLAGRVFNDNNGDGTAQAGEPGIPGQTLNVNGTDVFGNPVSATVVTGTNGNWHVDNLPPGNYTVTQPGQPSGTQNGSTSVGSAGGAASNPAGGGSVVSGITLAPGTAAVDYNFAELSPGAAITGRVWLDNDNSGAPNGSEAGIAGVVIELTGTDLVGSSVSLSTTTDASGNFRFDNLLPGNYSLREPTQPTQLGVTTLNGRTVAGIGGGTASAAGTAPSGIAVITLAAGQTASGYLFGEILPAEVAGLVFADRNNNGQVDAGESGLTGVAFALSGTDDLGNPVSASVTSAADGTWRFANMRPGTYSVTEPNQPAGTTNGITTAGPLGGSAAGVAEPVSAVSNIVLTPGSVANANLFAEIGNSPDLRVAKRHAPNRFTAGLAGSYTISVRNAGELPTSGAYTVTDRLPAGITLVSTPSGNGWACVGAAGASAFTCNSSTVLAAGASAADVISVPVVVAASAALGTAGNAVMVEGGGEIAARGPSADERAAVNGNGAALPACDAAMLHNACRDSVVVQASAAVSGTVWLDQGSSTRLLDGTDQRLAGWRAEVVDSAGSVLASATTAADGTWRASGLEPGVALQVRFREPASGVVFGYPVNGETAPGSSGASCVADAATRGTASSCPLPAGQPVLDIVLAAGAELPQQSLPVVPGGVVYDAITRQPVNGATVTLAPTGSCPGYDPATQVASAGLGGYTVSGNAIAMTVGAQGWYQFLFLPTAPLNCPFGYTVTPPAGYNATSVVIPPTTGTLSPVGDATTTFPVQPQAVAPVAPVGTATAYYTSILAGSSVSAIVNNHLPVDPNAPQALSLRKTVDRAQVELGDTLRYSITVQLTAGALPAQTTVVDRLPAGFTYVPGTAQVNGVKLAAEPQGGVGPVLAFQLGAMATSTQPLVLQYRVRVGVGSQQGDGTNRATAYACQAAASCVGADGRTPLAGSTASNEGRARVLVSGGVFGDAACLAGKVFVDCNHNHVQDREELGIPGVRLVLQDGTALVADVEGKYSVCGLPPKSHVLRIDPSTLPRGSRLSTSSSRNLGDAGSLWLDLKNGELHRADFVEGSCSNTVLEQVKARRAQGEVRAPETEKPGAPALRFDSKAHGLSTFSSPQQGTDGANQLAPKPRSTRQPTPGAPSELPLPTPALPMNQPPPTGRPTGTSPQGGSDASR